MKRAIVLMVVYFVITNLLSIPVLAIVSFASVLDASHSAGGLDTKAIQDSILQNPMMGTGMGIVMLLSQLIMGIILWKGRTLKPIEDFSMKFSPVILLLCIPMVLGISFSMNCLSDVLDLPNIVEEQMSSMMHSTWGILSIVVGAPILEEMLFRGAIQGHFLRRGKSPVYAILMSSLLFGLFHMNPAQIPFAVALGTLLGWVYYRTGSLWASILCHYINNGSAVLLTYLYPNVNTMEELIGDARLEWTIAVIGLILASVMVWIIARWTPTPEPVPECEWDTTEVFPKKNRPVCADIDNSLS